MLTKQELRIAVFSTAAIAFAAAFVFVVFAGAAVLSLLSYLIWSSYQEAIRLAESTTRNEAAILAARAW